MVSARFLLDTNVLSEPTRRRPDRKVLEKLQRFEGTIVTSSTVWSELWFGALSMAESERAVLVRAYLADLERTLAVLPYDKTAARWHASERARLRSLSAPPPFADGQDAAVAAANDLILVTDNVKDLARFEGLQVENWHRNGRRHT